jgi:hypothetical protein
MNPTVAIVSAGIGAVGIVLGTLEIVARKRHLRGRKRKDSGVEYSSAELYADAKILDDAAHDLSSTADHSHAGADHFDSTH